MSKNKQKFVPYIPASKSLPELTVVAMILGILLAIVFGAANAYLGLKIGLTVSASIPAAVISMAILRGLFRRKSILENNIVQTMTTAGEAVAAGAIFTLPALYLWDLSPSQAMIAFIVVTGGLLGVLMMVPLRRLLIVNEHEVLPYPEGTACAEVLKSGETGGTNAKLILSGFIVGGLFKALGDGLRWFKTSVETQIIGYKNAVLGMSTMPALLGVGYIIGPRIAGQMIAGGLLASVVFIPMISFFTQGSPAVFFPSEDPVGGMDASAIYSSYITYIGAGAVAMGGLITLVKTLPILFTSVRDTLQGLLKQDHNAALQIERTDKDLPMHYILGGSILLILIIAFVPVTKVGIIGAICIALFGFLFVAVASRIVGIVGSSSMPVSGMTIATLLITTLIFKAIGFTGQTGMIVSLTSAAIVCVAIAVAGDISQDLKTGYLVGATPWKQQIAMMVGVLASGLLIGYVLYLFDQAYEIGSEALPAPKAMLMKIIVEGLMQGNLPWELIIMGAALAITIEFLGINSLTVAVGFYLPISISAPIMVGGIVRWLTTRFSKTEAEKQGREEAGTLFASGLIAGEALLSVVVALLIVPGIIDPEAPFKVESQLLPLLLFLALVGLLGFVAVKFANKNVKGSSSSAK
ncbi:MULTISPECIES: OPT family oligopeptide transporter [Thermoactinomyces]|uniref:Oligopeptide transporter, OPT family n=1 Tax=Thermoactinomyces vulgaris TaxID=2026 RepID=A0ABS0QIN6_THEVU|nr:MULTISPECIES: oligopeptide transporter, OPT family [Thermoactinomyces]MBH8584181.1 oligopeptide transporter, OPT family [Thermoactinomyces sp. CICC 10735]MBH8586671.1 oligopeptide transporter, OPT family [Thermoactinomyces sp. CICC 10520]MBI0387648.1 oligopeptide transporter, OPT family [Thermoactinomyces sp. CICC 24227]MBI0392423.1 oligopeptide transporter, OPT family [Thermoactinomyces sp. CICC 24226]KFZ41032.1 peptide transporter [Thermoactinomyces sp. Gus2-1]